MTVRENLRRWGMRTSRAAALKTAAEWDSDCRRNDCSRKTCDRKVLDRKLLQEKTGGGKDRHGETRKGAPARRAGRRHARGFAQANRRDQSASGRAVQPARA